MEPQMDMQQMLVDSVTALLDRHRAGAEPNGSGGDLWPALAELGLPAAEAAESAGGLGVPTARAGQ